MKKVAVPKSQLSDKYDFVEKESFEEERIIDPHTGEEKIVQKMVKIILISLEMSTSFDF